MTNDFQWQTEDENWPDEPAHSERPKRPKKRPWLPAILALLIVAANGALH
jgi:hypothetical protein